MIIFSVLIYLIPERGINMAGKSSQLFNFTTERINWPEEVGAKDAGSGSGSMTGSGFYSLILRFWLFSVCSVLDLRLVFLM